MVWLSEYIIISSDTVLELSSRTESFSYKGLFHGSRRIVWVRPFWGLRRAHFGSNRRTCFRLTLFCKEADACTVFSHPSYLNSLVGNPLNCCSMQPRCLLPLWVSIPFGT